MATITKRKRKDGTVSYTAQIRLTVDGQKYTESKTSPDKRFLQRWAAKREADLTKPGVMEQEKHRGTTLGDVLEWYKEDFNGATKFGRSKLSHIDYLINHSLSLLDAVHLQSSDLVKHAHRRAKTAKAATINNDFIWLRNAMQAVQVSRGIPVNLKAIDEATYILRKERVIAKSSLRDRRPTIQELEKILAYLVDRDTRSQLPMVDIVLFAIFSTRRQGEICSIRWEDLDERRHGVLVREMKHPRDKKDTFVFLPDIAWSIIHAQEKLDDRIFPYVSKSVSAAFTKTCQFLEIVDLDFHDLRHEGISHLFELEWDIPKVAAVSGHKSWGSLQRYVHLRESGYYDKYQGWDWIAKFTC